MPTVYNETAFDRAIEHQPVSAQVKNAAIIYESHDWGNDADVHKGIFINESGGDGLVFQVDQPHNFVDVYIVPPFNPGGGTTNENVFFDELTDPHYRLGVEAYDLINGAYDNNLRLGAEGGPDGSSVYGWVFGPHVTSETIVNPY